MLFVHEVHHIRGSREEEFEAAFREEWMPVLAKDDEARLLWYFNHAHGSGPAYRVVTITGVKDGAALQRLMARVQTGDLQDWARQIDDMRHRVDAKTLLPVPWSPIQELDLGAVPTDGSEHELSIYMEDTGWPHAALDDYIGFWGEKYYAPMKARGTGLLDIQIVFQPAWGAGRRKEAILLQKIVDHDRLLHLLTHDTDPVHRQPGMFMTDALGYRDQWESKLLRTSAWSPRW
jgi:hypothetical protein